jgi:hypothetical protein
VNPQWHAEFVALCALFPSGELTEEEWALLQVHLAYCDACRTAFDEYQQIASDVVPLMAASAAYEPDRAPESTSFSLEVAEQRLMGRVESTSSGATIVRSPRRSWMMPAGVLAAGLTFAGALAGLHFYHSKTGPRTQPSDVAQVAAVKPVETSADSTNLQADLQDARQKIAALEQQVTETKDNFQQSNATMTRLQQQIDAETAERKRISDERDQFQQQLVAAQSDAQSLRDKTATTTTVAAQQTARVTSLEARLRDANTALEEKDKMLALDKEFLAHDRDIRDLIGARDLYIADIYDVAENGKTNKPFGRIFYTKDRSLVFYGYDLDKQAGLKESVAFQAWGSGDDKQDVSLGLFYQDDTHKRWVLRFSDTKTLAHLSKVFVTAEPKGGSTKPTGKPLLLAYLQIQPNHP